MRGIGGSSNGGASSGRGLIPDSRVTIEILDDASPDATPRVDEESENFKKIQREKAKLAAMQSAEQQYRGLQFNEEKSRLLDGKDTFVAGIDTTAQDVEIERQRLAQLEESARARAKADAAEITGQRQYLQHDKSALKMQAAFRGHIGRQKYAVTRKLQNMLDEDEYGDWVEVRDPDSGDVWFYNQSTGRSQWSRPAAMDASGKRGSSSSKNGNNNNSGAAGSVDSSGKLPSIMRDTTMSPPRSAGRPNKRHRMTAGSKSLEIGADAGGAVPANRTLHVSMSLPSLDATNIGKTSNMAAATAATTTTVGAAVAAAAAAAKNEEGDYDEEERNAEAKREVNALLGIDKLERSTGLMAPDGSFKPQLRTVVLDALLDTRFDSVSTVLADDRWYEADEDVVAKSKKKSVKSNLNVLAEEKQYKANSEDITRTPLVSSFNLHNKKSKRGKVLESSDGMWMQSKVSAMSAENLQGVDENGETINDTRDLTFRQVEHNGFEPPSSHESMCFGCWSAGLQRKCELHAQGEQLKPSQTMLLCRNWDLDVMRRRYRSEEIQELFLARESSLRFDAKRKRFSTVTEQRHPIYRVRSQLNDMFNSRMVLFEKIKRWLLSLSEVLRTGDDLPPAASELSHFLRLKRDVVNHSKVQRFSTANQALIPVAPITGYSWPERIGTVQFLFKHHDVALNYEVDLIVDKPTPTHRFLYLPREYHLPLPQTIPMPQPAYDEDSERVRPTNTFIADDHDAAWLEKIASAVAHDSVSAARAQVKAFTPVSQVELLRRTKKPPPNTIKSASIGRKPAPDNNMAIGGLSMELLVYQLICTFIPTQYGNFMVMDKAPVSPGVSAEVNISFASIVMAPIVQAHILRELEHPLNYRRAPTITLNSNVTADACHFYGLNRPEQTGEQDFHGFRTTAWAPMLLTYVESDPQAFVPGQGVVSLNDPKANVSRVTNADYTYPFCEPSTRDNSTLDFYHLLLTGVVSANKAQVFTALTVQEPGAFMKAYDSDAPLGHLVVSVYRSWAFTQRDTIQEFRTDDGVSYWYHRKTGQTFWERPLYEEEEPSPLLGGTVLDMEHAEEPLEMTKGEEGATRRYLQGEFRQQMLNHIETKKDAENRRQAAAVTVKNARQRGQIPELVGFESINNNAMSSAELGTNFDFSRQLNSSMQPNNTMSSAGIADMGGGGGGELVLMGDPVDLDPDAGPRSPLTNVDDVMSPKSASRGGGTGGTMGFSRPTTAAESGFGAGAMSSSRPPTGAPKGFVAGSRLDGDGSMLHQQSSYRASSGSQPPSSAGLGGGGAGLPGTPGEAPTSTFPGVDPNTVGNLSNMIGQMMNNMMLMDTNHPESMVQLGMGMAMALMSSGAVQNVIGNQHDLDNPKPVQSEVSVDRGRGSMSEAEINSQVDNSVRETGIFPSIGEEEASQLSLDDSQTVVSRVSGAQGVSMLDNKNEPIGKVHATAIFSADKSLDHQEEQQQRDDVAQRMNEPLNTMEQARGLKVDINKSGKATDTPDVAPPKALTNTKPSNAETGLREGKSMPLVAYPELSTQLENGAPAPFQMQPPAGLGSSFVSKEEELSQKLVPGAGNEHLRRTVMPLPVGFFEAIEAKHIAKQAVDYLPQVPNLPQSRNIGRVKPRSAAADWLMIHFDPWSAGKNPLSTEFVPSLLEKAETFVEGGPAKAAEEFQQLRNNALQGAFVTVEDEAGLAQQRAEISKAEHIASDFKKVCSLCRHSKFADAEQLVNQPDWSVPIDYQDDQGNSLLHIVAQNGNKRMVKLCMRRGAALDLQNLTGQTPLHFAYGYGYVEVGDYLVSKGADDSIRNKDGLTCYEGLGAKELEYL